MPKILLQLAAAALVFSSFGQIVVTAKLRRPIRTANKFRHWVEHDALDPIPINTTYISHSKNATFEQLIQHEQPKLGTFPQRYIYNTKYWKGPGSPIVFVAWGEEPIRPLDFNFTPRNRSSWAPGNQAGMTNASRIMESLIGYQYFSQSETSMVLAEKIGAAVVILEHRYFGESVPVRNLSTANMRYNSIENAIADGVNFARNARLPFDPSGRSHAPQTPWVIMGGSMGGALASWTEFVSPGTFWAYWASSATVEGASSWAYTIPILEHMPKNCSRDVSRVIDHMDKIGRNGTKDEIKKFQAMFGLESIEHFGDFVSAVFDYSIGLWQDDLLGFYDFCDYVEDVDQYNVTVPGPDGVGLERALAGYALWTTRENAEDARGGRKNTVDFRDTYNPLMSLYVDLSINSDAAEERAYQWWQCTWPIGNYEVFPPAEYPSLVSRFVDDEYYDRMCDMSFSLNINGSNVPVKHRTYSELNKFTGGFSDRNSTRLLYINGEWDPWLHTTVSSRFRPGGPMKSTKNVPVSVIPQGSHTMDLDAGCHRLPACTEILEGAIRQIVTWISEFPGYRNASRVGTI